MKKSKLNYRFHNPNTADVTADYLLKVLIEANKPKMESAMREVGEEAADSGDKTDREYSA